VNVLDTTFKIGTIANMTVKAGNTASTNVAFAGIDNFAGQVAVTCSLPVSMYEARCSSTPASLAGSASATSMLTIVTTAPHQIAANSHSLLAKGTIALGSIFILAFSGKRRRHFIAILVLVSIGSFTGCGGGGSSNGSGNGNQDQGTPKGTYAVNVSATSNNITRTATFTVTVQ
jgi:hypothetical protein